MVAGLRDRGRCMEPVPKTYERQERVSRSRVQVTLHAIHAYPPESMPVESRYRPGTLSKAQDLKINHFLDHSRASQGSVRAE
jgi:hypothetical protein